MIVLARINAWLESLLARLLTGLMLAMLAIVLWQVASRLFARAAIAMQWSWSLTPAKWSEELASFVLAWIALLGAAYALRRGEHMGYDSLFLSLDRADKARLTQVVQALVALFGALMALGGTLLVQQTLELGQRTPALGWPMGWVYAVAPLSGLMMVLFALERVYLDEGPEAAIELIVESERSAALSMERAP
jgi:TRAP-type C4-dicarboxylate transport system permease small subunit